LPLDGVNCTYGPHYFVQKKGGTLLPEAAIFVSGRRMKTITSIKWENRRGGRTFGENEVGKQTPKKLGMSQTKEKKGRKIGTFEWRGVSVAECRQSKRLIKESEGTRLGNSETNRVGWTTFPSNWIRSTVETCTIFEVFPDLLQSCN
jgi:hypothetical protein